MGLVDSGARTIEATGGMREPSTGKGREDLMPLDVIARLENAEEEDKILTNIQKYLDTGVIDFAYAATREAIKKVYIDTGKSKTYAGAMLEVAKQFEEGAEKYSPHNWRHGLKVSRYADSAIRHYFKWIEGWDDEPHDRAVIWNLICLIWTHEHLPEMRDNDLPYVMFGPVPEQ